MSTIPSSVGDSEHSRFKRLPNLMNSFQNLKIALAIGIAFTSYGCANLKDGRVAAAGDVVDAVKVALDCFKLETGRWPTKKEGLQVLFDPQKFGVNSLPMISTRTNRNGEILDLYGEPIVYERTRAGWRLISSGIDRNMSTLDDKVASSP